MTEKGFFLWFYSSELIMQYESTIPGGHSTFWGGWGCWAQGAEVGAKKLCVFVCLFGFFFS